MERNHFPIPKLPTHLDQEVVRQWNEALCLFPPVLYFVLSLPFFFPSFPDLNTGTHCHSMLYRFCTVFDSYILPPRLFSSPLLYCPFFLNFPGSVSPFRIKGQYPLRTEDPSSFLSSTAIRCDLPVFIAFPPPLFFALCPPVSYSPLVQRKEYY